MLAIFISGVLWGSIGFFVKTLNILGADTSYTGFLRMTFAFLIMLVICIFKFGKNILIRDKKTLLTCLLLGLLCHGLFNIFYINSIKLNGMAIAAVLMYSAPVFTALGAKIFFHEKFTGFKILALIINILGCILTATGGNIFNASIKISGVLFGIGSGFCYGMVAVIGRMAGEKTNSLLISLYSCFAAMIFLFVFTQPEIFFESRVLGIGFLYGLIPTCLAYLFYYAGIKKVSDTSKVPVIASIEPVTAVILGYILYHESVSAGNLAGMILVLISVFMAMK